MEPRGPQQQRKGMGFGLFGIWVVALGLTEWRRKSQAQQLARDSFYPGSAEAMVRALVSLRPYGDAESRALYRSLEDLLRRKDPRAWRRAQRRLRRATAAGTAAGPG